MYHLINHFELHLLNTYSLSYFVNLNNVKMTINRDLWYYNYTQVIVLMLFKYTILVFEMEV